MIDVAMHNGVACVQGRHSAYGMPWSVCLFFFDGMVVDASAKVFEQALIPFYQSNPIERVILTHTHDDHIGTAGWLQNHQHVPIYVHPAAVDFCAEPCDYAGTFRETLWGKRDPFAALPLGESIDSPKLTNDFSPKNFPSLPYPMACSTLSILCDRLWKNWRELNWDRRKGRHPKERVALFLLTLFLRGAEM